MTDEIRELELNIAYFLRDLCAAISEDTETECYAISCDRCPLWPENANIAARGFVRELLYEKGERKTSRFLHDTGVIGVNWWRCFSCGQKLQDEDRYCPNCGRRIIQ